MIDDIKITTRDFLSLGIDEHIATCMYTEMVRLYSENNAATITQTEQRICSKLKEIALQQGGSGIVGLKFMSSNMNEKLYITGYGTIVKEL